MAGASRRSLPSYRNLAVEAPDNSYRLTTEIHMLMRYDGQCKLARVTASTRRLLHLPVCQMANVAGRLGFASERDLVAFAAWLGQAQPLLKPLPEDQGVGEGAAGGRRVHIRAASLAHLATLLI